MTRSIVLAAMLVFGVLAQAVQAADPNIPTGVFIQRQGGDQQLARDFLIGAQVYNADNKIVGDVEDLILDELNTVEGVIIGTDDRGARRQAGDRAAGGHERGDQGAEAVRARAPAEVVLRACDGQGQGAGRQDQRHDV